MRKSNADMWGAMVSTIVCAVVITPAIVGGLQSESVRLVPGAWWAAGSVAFLIVQLSAMWMSSVRPVTARFMLGVQVLLGPVLVLTAPGAGWVPIILVFTAATAAHLVPVPTTIGIVVGNTIVLAVLGWMNAGAGPLTAGETTEIMLGALIYLLLQVATVLSVYSMIHEGHMRRELAVAHTELATASALLAESSRVDERMRIARELHDLIGHQLTVLTLELEVASHKASPAAAENVGRARQVARDLLADVRLAVGELRERAPRLRESLARIVNDLPDLAVRVDVDDDLVADEELSTVFIRCVQEIVTNVIRHAQASELWIELTGDGDTITLTAADDGSASDRFEIGNGLRGLTERVEQVGGTTRFWVDGGFRVRVTVPAAALEHA